MGLMTKRFGILEEHYSRLLSIVTAASSSVKNHVTEADLASLRQLREELAAALSAYQRCVHLDIFLPTPCVNDESARADAQAIKLGCITVENDYEAFRQRWVHRDVISSVPPNRHSADATNRWWRWRPTLCTLMAW